MAIKRAEFRDPNDVIGRSTSHRYILSTPMVACAYLQAEAERMKRMIEQIQYHKRYNQRLLEQGFDLSMSCADRLFDDDMLDDGIDDLDGRDIIS